MALCTMSFVVKDPDKYVRSNETKEGKEKLDSFCKKFDMQIINSQRINSSNAFTMLVSFKDLNKFVESLVYFRENMWDQEVMGQYTSPTFHIIDPDYNAYNKKVPQILDLLEKVLKELFDYSQEFSKIKSKLDGYSQREWDSHVETRANAISTTMNDVQQALHMLRYKDDNQGILN